MTVLLIDHPFPFFPFRSLPFAVLPRFIPPCSSFCVSPLDASVATVPILLPSAVPALPRLRALCSRAQPKAFAYRPVKN